MNKDDVAGGSIAEMLTILELIEIDLTAGDMPAKMRVALALSRVRATIRKAKGLSPEGRK